MRRLAFAASMLLAFYLGGRGITDEASGTLGGDMSRYVMNGVYMYDLISEGGVWGYHELVAHAERYYVKYPALSLGHHPPLASLALVPFYAVFGVSIVAARLCALVFFAVAVWQLFSLVSRIYGWYVAFWAALLFVSNSYVLHLGQPLFSEMPMVTLVLVSLNALHLYQTTRQIRFFTWFVIAAAASLYAKQLGIFMFPVYALVLVAGVGWRQLLVRPIILRTILGALMIAPLAAMTAAFAGSNVAIAAWNVNNLGGDRGASVPEIVDVIVRRHLSWPLLGLVLAGAIRLVARHDRPGVVWFTWVMSALVGSVIFAATVEPERYAFVALPAYAIVAATLAIPASLRRHSALGVVLLVGVLSWQVSSARRVQPSGAGGYETAAAEVVSHSASPTVLFDSFLDTGYFVFFVRKHDVSGRLVVLQADQILKSHDDSDGTDASPDASGIYSTLRAFGIQFIVVEARTEGPPILRQLWSELASDRFVERSRIPVASLDPRASGLELVVYEFKDAQPPDLDAEIEIQVRSRQWKMRLRDLLGQSAGRR